MNEDHKAVTAVIEAIKKFVDSRLRTAKFDITKQGIVTKVLSDNKYKVQIHKNELTIPCCTEQSLKINDKVLILCVQNDFKNKYIIGKG